MTTGNKVLYGDYKEYPKGIKDIPFASYLKITRYQYNEGIKKARASGQQGVGAALGNEGAQKLIDKVRGASAFTFGGLDMQSGELNRFNAEVQAIARSQMSKGADKDKRNGTLKKIKEGDYSNINFPIKLQDGTEVETSAELASIKNKAIEVANSTSSIYFLPMPNEFQYSYGAEWGNTFKLGTMARLLDDPAGTVGQMALTGTLGAGGEAIKQLGGEALEAAGGDISNLLGAAFKSATDPFKVSGELNATNVLGLAGLAPNENAIMMFSKMSMREFSLSFEFFSRDENEANDIDRIINGFKTGMHPTANTNATGGVLGFPDVFLLEPWFGITDEDGNVKDGGIPHPMMPRSKMCALTSLSVNSSPSNNFITTKDGKLPLQTVQMSFAETTALTRSDLDTGKF